MTDDETAELAADVEAFLARDLRTVMLTADPLAVARIMAALQSMRADLPLARRARLEALLRGLEAVAAHLG